MKLQELHEMLNIKPLAKLPNEVAQPDAKIIDEYCKLVEKFSELGEMTPQELVNVLRSKEGKRMKELEKVVRPFFAFRGEVLNQARFN